MSKNIVVEVDQDGFVVAVYCPDETYVVDLLDHADWNRDEGMSELDPAIDKYYRDVQNSTKELKNCY